MVRLLKTESALVRSLERDALLSRKLKSRSPSGPDRSEVC